VTIESELFKFDEADLIGVSLKSVQDQIMEQIREKLRQGVPVNLIFNGEVVMTMYPDGTTEAGGLRYWPNGRIRG